MWYAPSFFLSLTFLSLGFLAAVLWHRGKTWISSTSAKSTLSLPGKEDEDGEVVEERIVRGRVIPDVFATFPFSIAITLKVCLAFWGGIANQDGAPFTWLAQSLIIFWAARPFYSHWVNWAYLIRLHVVPHVDHNIVENMNKLIKKLLSFKWFVFCCSHVRGSTAVAYWASESELCKFFSYRI